VYGFFCGPMRREACPEQPVLSEAEGSLGGITEESITKVYGFFCGPMRREACPE